MAATAQTIAARFVLLQLLALLLAACGAKTVPLPLLSADATILAFGDSLTAGVGAGAAQNYPAVLAKLVNRDVINAGVPGETTAGGRERLPEVLDESEVALVILCLGGNDMLRGVDRAQTKANLAAMIEEIQRRNLPLVLLGVPRPALLGMEAEPLYAELARQYNVPLEAEVLPDVLGDRSRKSDQIHPNASGYRDMATAVVALLRKAGAV